MKNLFIGSLVALSAVSCTNSADTTGKTEGDSLVPPTTASVNVLNEEQQKEGWQLLFDGQTTKGWHKYGGGPVGSAWKVADGTLYLDTTDKKDWQIKDGGDIVNNGHPDSKIIKHRAGDLYDLISSSKETVKPAGEWNLAEIKSLNGKLELSLNGEVVVSTTLWDDAWKKLIAGSKFKTMPGFGTYQKGKIGLQDHDNMVWYRNVMIRKL